MSLDNLLLSATDHWMSFQVYKYERLQPLSYYAAAEQLQQPTPGLQLLWGAKEDGEEALRARCLMLRYANAQLA
jgi:hypothetical protein